VMLNDILFLDCLYNIVLFALSIRPTQIYLVCAMVLSFWFACPLYYVWGGHRLWPDRSCYWVLVSLQLLSLAGIVSAILFASGCLWSSGWRQYTTCWSDKGRVLDPLLDLRQLMVFCISHFLTSMSMWATSGWSLSLLLNVCVFQGSYGWFPLRHAECSFHCLVLAPLFVLESRSRGMYLSQHTGFRSIDSSARAWCSLFLWVQVNCHR
jgi:hypothetical protein